MIVDDEECLRSMLITILEDENFLNIITADCVKTALEICQQEKPDIAILDVMLPDGNGFELMETLRSFTNIPVIFLTAKDDIQDKYSGFGLGADDYITKPFMPKELIFRLNAVLRRCYKEDSPLIELRDCKIDLANAQVIWEDKQIVAEKELADMYEELKIVENVADLGKNVKKLETMVRKGPDNPKGIMSAKNYREKIVIPFIDKMYDAFKNVVKFAKGCFAQLKELTEKYNEQLEVNEMLRKQNSRLRESIDEQEKEIDGLYDDRKKLGYFKKFLKKEDYNKVVEMGEENYKRNVRSR